MSWRVALVAVRCGCCLDVIATGQPARFGDHAPVVWCAACAARLLGEDVPALEPQAAMPDIPAKRAVLPLFGESMGKRFKSADAREALDGLRSALGGQAKDGAR